MPLEELIIGEESCSRERTSIRGIVLSGLFIKMPIEYEEILANLPDKKITLTRKVERVHMKRILNVRPVEPLPDWLKEPLKKLATEKPEEITIETVHQEIIDRKTFTKTTRTTTRLVNPDDLV